MKIRILSDLHLDINGYPPPLSDKDSFTIICGDIAGSVQTACQWLDENIHNGLFVAGNHMFYSEPKLTVEDIVEKYQAKYPLDKPVSFLNNSYKIIDDTVFVGATLWTDYRLFGAGAAPLYKYAATMGMNDFRLGHIRQNGRIARLTPEYCEAQFEQSLAYIKKVVEAYPDKNIVVITHHAPSVKSVDKEYLNSGLSPSFANNLDQFILDHPNIKLWCHGHIHSFKNYQIGKCRVVCNPKGYARLNEKTRFQPNFTVDLKGDRVIAQQPKGPQRTDDNVFYRS